MLLSAFVRIPSNPPVTASDGIFLTPESISKSADEYGQTPFGSGSQESLLNSAVKMTRSGGE